MDPEKSLHIFPGDFSVDPNESLLTGFAALETFL